MRAGRRLRHLALPFIPFLAVTFTVAGIGTATRAFAKSPTTVNVKPTVYPRVAGTKRHPRGVKLRVHMTWHTPGDGQKPIVQHFRILFPKGSLYNGRKYKRCSKVVLNHGGPSHCPRGAIMGHGTGNAFADTVITHPKITVVNGGPKRVYFYTVLNNPARVQEPVVGKIKRVHGKWAYQLDVKVPKDLQIVAGVPIQLTLLKVTAGKGDWLATTGCHHGKWPFKVTTWFNTGGSATDRGAVRCKSRHHARRGPRVALGRVHTMRMRTLLRRGVRTRAKCSSSCRLKLKLTISPRAARRHRLISRHRYRKLRHRRHASVTVGHARSRLRGHRSKVVRVRLTRHARHKLRRAHRLTLRLTATTRHGGRRGTAARTVRVKR